MVVLHHDRRPHRLGQSIPPRQDGSGKYHFRLVKIELLIFDSALRLVRSSHGLDCAQPPIGGNEYGAGSFVHGGPICGGLTGLVLVAVSGNCPDNVAIPNEPVASFSIVGCGVSVLLVTAADPA